VALCGASAGRGQRVLQASVQGRPCPKIDRQCAASDRPLGKSLSCVPSFPNRGACQIAHRVRACNAGDHGGQTGSAPKSIKTNVGIPGSIKKGCCSGGKTLHHPRQRGTGCGQARLAHQQGTNNKDAKTTASQATDSGKTQDPDQQKTLRDKGQKKQPCLGNFASARQNHEESPKKNRSQACD